MTDLRGKVVVVTGAGSGIGRALALALVEKGAEVAYSDVNERGLGETTALLAGRGRSSAHVLDVSKREQWEAHAAAVRAQHGGADVLINNAGVAIRSSFEKLSIDDFEFVMGVNFWGVIYGSKTFLPLMRERGAGHIVNISSINGIVPFANQVPYNCSKYAVLGFSETLMQELRGEPIRVTSVHPGGIRTNIVRSGRGMNGKDADNFDKIALTSAASAAAQILRGIEKNSERVYVGADAKLMSASKRLLPALTVNLWGRASGDRGPIIKRDKSAG
jgi:NAD(P)-dependent dehydrogenase (short-subunit alcohol dehydrogenase family)